MSQYLDDPELTRRTHRQGWLSDGRSGTVRPLGHLQLFWTKKTDRYRGP